MNLSFILSEMPSEDGRSQTPPSVAVSAPPARPHVVVQFVKFGIVGVSNTLLTFLVYTLLLKVFGVWYLAASAIGFVVGATNGFLLNRRWTFREHVGDALTPVRWAIVQIAGSRSTSACCTCSSTTPGSTSCRQALTTVSSR